MTTPVSKSSLVAGIVAATAGALAGAVIWAVIASVTNYKIVYAAVGVGALAGFLGGKVSGGSAQLAPIAAGIGIAGCFLGDLMISTHELAQYTKVGSFEVFTKHLDTVWAVYKYEFDFLSAIFYLFAGVAAYRLAQSHAVQAQQAADPAAPTWAPPTVPPEDEN